MNLPFSFTWWLWTFSLIPVWEKIIGIRPQPSFKHKMENWIPNTVTRDVNVENHEWEKPREPIDSEQKNSTRESLATTSSSSSSNRRLHSHVVITTLYNKHHIIVIYPRCIYTNTYYGLFTQLACSRCIKAYLQICPLLDFSPNPTGCLSDGPGPVSSSDFNPVGVFPIRRDLFPNTFVPLSSDVIIPRYIFLKKCQVKDITTSSKFDLDFSTISSNPTNLAPSIF